MAPTRRARRAMLEVDTEQDDVEIRMDIVEHRDRRRWLTYTASLNGEKLPCEAACGFGQGNPEVLMEGFATEAVPSAVAYARGERRRRGRPFPGDGESDG